MYMDLNMHTETIDFITNILIIVYVEMVAERSVSFERFIVI